MYDGFSQIIQQSGQFFTLKSYKIRMIHNQPLYSALQRL